MELQGASSQLNLTPGVTPVSQSIYDLHMIVFWICVGIAVVVFGVIFYTLIFHRKSRGIEPANFHEHTALEILWAIIPFVILIAMAIPAVDVLYEMHNTEDDELGIQITGYQWYWRYQYLDQGISFYSRLTTPIEQRENKASKTPDYLLQVDKPLILPVNTKIRFFVTSNDVIHSWWVPAFGVKRDAIPGFINEAWTIIEKPGTYVGQCAELCGVYHAYMPIVVKAVSKKEFANWVDKHKKPEEKTQDQTQDQTEQAKTEKSKAAETASTKQSKEQSKEQSMKLGKNIYNSVCAVCHQANGAGSPPIFPAITGSKIVNGPVDKQIELILNGVKGTSMQSFAAQLSDEEIAAVITYQRNALGNNTGQWIKAEQVKKIRDEGAQ